MVFLWQHQSASKIIVTSCACLVPMLMLSSGLWTMLGRWVRANQSFRPSLMCVQNSPLFHLKTGLAALLPPCASAPIVRAISKKILGMYDDFMIAIYMLVYVTCLNSRVYVRCMWILYIYTISKHNWRRATSYGSKIWKPVRCSNMME